MAGAATLPNFGDFDIEPMYRLCEEAILHADTRNFVIEFDSEKAYAALNLDGDAVTRFLQTQRAKNTSTRWINIWAPERQKEVVKELSTCYNFSPRLLGIMCSEHNTPLPVPENPQSSSPRSRVKVLNRHSTERKSAESHFSDLEKDEKGVPLLVHSPMLDLSHYKMVNEVWHYCSVDWGSRYLCLGYNSLSDTAGASKSKPKVEEGVAEVDNVYTEAHVHADNKPKGARTWTWLVLCDDGTIISIYEDPLPGHQGSLDAKGHGRLLIMRRNLLNVFKQLSKVNDAHRTANPIHTLDIRPGLLSNQTSDTTIADSPGLLFYYLFDDWYTTYSLVAKREHQYAVLLEKLRRDMFLKPHVELIQQLHQYGRQLGVLKRMYQSYALIIERILDRQKPVNRSSAGDSGSNSSHIRQVVQESNTTLQLRDESPAPNAESSAEIQKFGAPLSSAATVRFERLRDRINHYALSEIQECIDEKDSLVFLNFNLISLKESQAVERLTRITILLAKVTILFMPVSLMTGYFSVQISDLVGVYTVKTYWVCFAVVMTLSFLFVAAFGLVSGTLEGKPIYRSLTQTVLDAGRGKWRERRQKKMR